MSDAVTRLNAALEGRYRLEHEPVHSARFGFGPPQRGCR